MSKNHENELINAIIGLHQEIKGLRKEMHEQLAKVNAGLIEMRTSYMKLDNSFKEMRGDINKMDNSFNYYAESYDKILKGHEKRIIRLEDKTFGDSFVGAPRAGYKRIKKSSKKIKKK